MSSVFQAIRLLVKTIPQGKVTTYGLIAQAVGTDPRVVGWALRGNLNKSIPCHRVVQKKGTLSPGFSLDGPKEQARRLKADGVIFTKNPHTVDLTKCLFVPKPWPTPSL